MTNTSILAAFERFWQHVVSALGKKADVVHEHGISDITNLQTELDDKADVSHEHDEATQSESGFMSADDKRQLVYGGIPIVTTSGTGAAYTVTIDGVTDLVRGMRITIIPHVTSTTYNTTLNVNNLGNKQIYMPLIKTTNNAAHSKINEWLHKNQPVTLQYSGAIWMTVDFPRVQADNMEGVVPIANGGTGGSSADQARIYLDVYSKAQTDTAIATAIGNTIAASY